MSPLFVQNMSPFNGADPFGLIVDDGRSSGPDFGPAVKIGGMLRKVLGLGGGSGPRATPVPTAAGTGPMDLYYLGQATEVFKSDAADAVDVWRDVYDCSFGNNAILAAVMGNLAALGTEPEATAIVLGAAVGYEERPFWRYTDPPFSTAGGKWLGRGAGLGPQYGKDFHRAKDMLQLPKLPTDVEPVVVPWYEPVIGPRYARENPQWGAGGGLEWKRGWKW